MIDGAELWRLLAAIKRSSKPTAKPTISASQSLHHASSLYFNLDDDDQHIITTAFQSLSTSISSENENEMTTNPSHILIARGSRGHNPSAALSSPTETHAAASGIFRSSPQAHRGPHGHGHHGACASSGQWVIEDSEADSEQGSDETSDVPFEDVELDSTFTREGRFPGTVKIVVEGTTFFEKTGTCSRFWAGSTLK